jgi:uncharacterized membrane protein YoaK (UPF0700 family)
MGTKDQAFSAYTEQSNTAFQMAAIAGFVDVFCFVNYSRLFTAHITGNIVIAITEMIHHTPGITIKLIALPVFSLVAMGLVWIIEHLGRTRSLLAVFLMLEAIFLALFMIAGKKMASCFNEASIPYIGTGMFAVAAMAIHNTLLSTFMYSLPPCTVMTGNFCKFLVDIVSSLYGKTSTYPLESSTTSNKGIRRYGNVLLAFCIGGFLAALGTITIGFWSISVPIIALFYMIFRCLMIQNK